MRPPRGTVLAIEDDPVLCQVLSELLTRDGLAVETIADGASGLARLAAGDVDLVILDILLPDLDGLELCRQLRARGGDVYMPIIMLTALGAELERRAGFAAGADDYIVKPFEAGDLLDRVHAWLETRARLKDAHERLVRLQRQLWESERLRAEAATLQLAAIVESSDDAIISHTLDGVIVSWNPGAERLYGYSALEAIGHPLSMLIPTTRGSELPGILASLQRGERVEPYETVRVRKDGSTIDVSMSISPMRDPSGVIATAASIARDITERRSAERLKDEFVSMVSHEIRTPLNSVIGMTGLLLDTSLDPQQREYAEIVRRSGQGLLAIINDILDYSKIEAGKLDLEAIDLDVREVVEDVAELLASEAQQKNVELVTDVQPDLPRALRGDPGRLRQILPTWSATRPSSRNRARWSYAPAWWADRPPRQPKHATTSVTARRPAPRQPSRPTRPRILQSSVSRCRTLASASAIKARNACFGRSGKPTPRSRASTVGRASASPFVSGSWS